MVEFTDPFEKSEQVNAVNHRSPRFPAFNMEQLGVQHGRLSPIRVEMVPHEFRSAEFRRHVRSISIAHGRRCAGQFT